MVCLRNHLCEEWFNRRMWKISYPMYEEWITICLPLTPCAMSLSSFFLSTAMQCWGIQPRYLSMLVLTKPAIMAPLTQTHTQTLTQTQCSHKHMWIHHCCPSINVRAPLTLLDLTYYKTEALKRCGQPYLCLCVCVFVCLCVCVWGCLCFSIHS